MPLILAVGVAVGSGAVVIVATGTLLLIVLWKCRRNTKGIASQLHISDTDCYFT